MPNTVLTPVLGTERVQIVDGGVTKETTTQDLANLIGVNAGVEYKGGYDANTNTPDLDTAPSGVVKGDMYTVTAAGTFFTVVLEVGDSIIAEIDNAAAEADWTVLQANIDGALTEIVQDTTPQLGGQLDVNGNAIGNGTEELLVFSEAASAVNEITVTNSATGVAPSLTASGDDVDIDLTLDGKGTGTVKTLSSNLDITGNIVVSGTVDGRDVATDGTKLDGVEALADVTDFTNVTAALDTTTTFRLGDFSAAGNNFQAVVSDSSQALQLLEGHLQTPAVIEVSSGAINLNYAVAYFDTGAGGETSTLAAGASGQIKTLAMTSDGGGDMVVTVTNPAWGGAGTITLGDVGDGCVLQYINSKWVCVGNNGCVFA